MDLMTPLLASALLAANIEMDYKSMRGFFLTVQGVPVIRGSFFQVYEKGWSKGYYSSRWRPQEVKRLQDGSLQVRFESLDRRVAGEHVYRRTEEGVRVEYEFKWKGTKPVKLENTIGLLWAPAFEQGVASAGMENNSELEKRPAVGDTIAKRMLLGRSSAFQFRTPFMDLLVRGNRGGKVLFDARRYPQQWAEGEVFWVGHQALDLLPDQPLRYTVELVIEPKLLAEPVEAISRWAAGIDATATAIGPVASVPRLIPSPRSVRYLSGSPCPADRPMKIAMPLGFGEQGKELEKLLDLRWRRRIHTQEPPIVLDTSIGDQSLPVEGYDLRVSSNHVRISARDGEGVVHAMRTLAQLARPSGGRLVFPQVHVRDWPSVQWRGVHVFAGPQARAFHEKLFDRVVAPLKFNRVVVQCERTEWKSVPGIATPLTTSRADLVAMFENFRSHAIEPIPLIQSFGHTQWLFANGQNLDLAVNPASPYAIDPRKQASRDLLERLWTEVCELLKPRVVHFGCDEISSRSWTDIYLSTRLWQRHIPFLGELARRLGVVPMFWGDMALSPKEAFDATHGDTQEQADMRKRAIPVGSFIGDWHYRPSTDPTKFPSLDLWKSLGMKPIATSWYRPENIYGHTHAAIRTGAGTLQATWAGHNNSEQSIYNELQQYAGYVLAAEYAWSGRTELPNQLTYKPDEVFRQLYFCEPSAVGNESGWHIMPSPKLRTLRIGEIEFGLFKPIALRWLLSAQGQVAPRQCIILASVRASELVLALETKTWLTEGERVGEVIVRFADGGEVREPLFYGRHVRSRHDTRPALISERASGLCAVRIGFGTSKPVESISLIADSETAGLQLSGITALVGDPQ